MSSNEETTCRAIIEQHIAAAIEEISESGVDVGYFPYDEGAFVDVVIALLKHQSRINEDHTKEETNFS